MPMLPPVLIRIYFFTNRQSAYANAVLLTAALSFAAIKIEKQV
jgi:hypothetical protein